MPSTGFKVEMVLVNLLVFIFHLKSYKLYEKAVIWTGCFEHRQGEM